MLKLIEQRAKTKITKEKAELTLTIAATYSEQGSHDSALVEYKRYLEIWESKEDNLQCAIANRYLAECYIELGDYTQAIVHTSRYLQLSLLVDNKMEQQRAYVTLGRCFLNRVETLRDGHLIAKSLKSASQALLNSIKLIKDLSPNLDNRSSAEMRAVSLLNLGHVQRAQHYHSAALESFVQCITLARKHSLQKILFRASYQAGEMLINKIPTLPFNACCHREFLKLMNQNETVKALEIVRTTLSSPISKPYVDNEAKLLCINLKELLAQIYLCNGSSRKAMKIFRLLKVDSPSSSEQYGKMIKTCFQLMNLLNEIPHEVSNTKDYTTSAYVHEKLGDLYSGIDLQGCAIRHYKFMLGFSELAHKHYFSESGVVPNEIIKLVDAALISVAETYRTLGCHDQCAEMYKREILWATSTGLSTNDITTSWLSLAQAQRLISINNSPTTCSDDIGTNQKTILYGSDTALDSLLSAHESSKSTGSKTLIADCLKELLDYYEQYNYHDKVQKTRQELENIQQATCSQLNQEGDDDEKSDETGDSDKNTSFSDENGVAQFLETLSSDSELEQFIGGTGLMDEFQDGTRSKKSCKALCLKTNMKGETPLHVAAINGDMDHVIKLVDVLGHPVNVPDGAGWLPIHEAAFHDRSEIATYLLDHGALLDDTGFPDDYSTPLFEAVHNGALTTALIFVNRGANLWHKNKQGEYLSNLLDQWEPTRHASGTFAEQHDYDRWCNLKRETPENQSSSNSESSTPIKKGNNRKSHSQYHSRSFSLCGTSDSSTLIPSSVNSKFKRKSLRSRNWDDLVVDLDEDDSSQPLSSIKLKQSTSAVASYKEAMKAIGSSKTRRQSHDNTDNLDAVKRRKKSRVIDAVDDDWLILDEKPKGSRCVSSSTVKGHFDTLNMKRRKSAATASDKNSHQDDLEFSPHLAFTSTQNDNLKSSQLPPPHPPPALSSSSVARASHIKLPPESTSKPVHQNKQLDHSLKGSSCSADKHALVNNKNSCSPTAVDNDSLKLSKFPAKESMETSHSVKVAFSDISVLVPVDSLSRSVSWLATEAYRRRQVLMGLNSNILNAECGELVRLSTRDRALLLPTDRLFSIIPVLSQSGSIVELLAELNESAIQNVPVGLSSKQHIQSQMNYESNSKEFCQQSMSPFQQSIIDKARNNGVVDLSNLSIDNAECCKFFGQLARSSIRAVTEVQLQENSSPNCINLTSYLCQISSQLVKLNLSMNLFNDEFINRFLCSLLKQFNKDKSSDVLMPRLQHLNLAYNPLLGYSMKKECHLDNDNLCQYESLTSHGTCWTTFIEDILKAFPKLTYLNLAGCSLGNNMNSANCHEYHQNELVPRNLFTDSFVSCLSELDLSWNPQISSNQLLRLFSMNCLKALRCLRLRGCSKMNPVNNHLCPITLPISTLELSSFNWFNKHSYEGFMKYLQKFNNFDKPSVGDQLLNSLCSALIEGNIRLQILDVGHCQLTYHCLTSLESLFGTPGTSITTLIIDHNPMLRNVIISDTCPFPSWIRIFQAIAQPASALVSLTIDLPQIPDNDDNLNALTAAFTSVESKLLPAVSPTPLQELVIVYSDTLDNWTPDNTSNYNVSNNSTEHRFLSMLSNLFIKRFGKMVKITNKNYRVTFSIFNNELVISISLHWLTYFYIIKVFYELHIPCLPEKTELENNETVINIEPITSPDGLLNKTQNVIPLLNESPLDNLKTAQTKEKLDKFTTDCRIMRRIIAEDSNYNLTIIPTLVDLCIKHCIENFEFNPTPIILPTNLSLKVTSHLINDELYWKRCCHAKWSITDVSYYDDSWKRAYFERYLQEIIETFIPGTTSIQRLDECVNYAAPYIQCLHIQQLLPPLKQMNKEKNTIDNDSISDSESDQLTVPNDMHHLDLTLILSKLTHLHELTLMYQVKQCGMNFDWSLFQFTMNDCLNLSKALQLYQQQLKALVQNSTLKELNLSVNDLHENTASYFGHAGSKKLQDGMDQNSCLIHLDLRFTGSSQEAEYAIKVPNVQQSIPSEITSVARRQRPLIEYPNEVSFAALEV
ncbi:Dynein regulatory complex subunit 5 [Schistosoma japonicum]|nr:Dynein regulatory complex subunit 5 [Schistosoma japonicum]